MNKLVTGKEQILTSYPDVFEDIGRFPGSPYHKQVDPNIMPKQTPCRPVHVHLKEAFKKEVDKMLKAGRIKPVHEATPWINSFILIKGKDQSGKLKLSICLDPGNLNKAVIREPYHFKNPRRHHLPNCQLMCYDGMWLQEGLLASRIRWSLIFPNHIQYRTGKILIYSHALWHYSHRGCLPMTTRPVLQPH